MARSSASSVTPLNRYKLLSVQACTSLVSRLSPRPEDEARHAPQDKLVPVHLLPFYLLPFYLLPFYLLPFCLLPFCLLQTKSGFSLTLKSYLGIKVI